ncbi:hypothetical protein E2C01_001735 [Portunus trituberculatus]|uniref:Uncharacterized protein n=1 Tax=Portunus trituberculatus TaxID=210409 RepID=A0A5B7CHF4_PORTR|nr:hypothetical protein [Portunus trituberculatus]
MITLIYTVRRGLPSVQPFGRAGRVAAGLWWWCGALHPSSLCGVGRARVQETHTPSREFDHEVHEVVLLLRMKEEEEEEEE